MPDLEGPATSILLGAHANAGLALEARPLLLRSPHGPSKPQGVLEIHQRGSMVAGCKSELPHRFERVAFKVPVADSARNL